MRTHEKMLKIVCGLSGSGKTTYVLNNKKENDVILDLDYLKDCFKYNSNILILKELQINLVSYFSSKNIDIWYITCFPSIEEQECFFDDAEYIWINTSYEKSIENIRKRDVKKGISAQEQLIKFNEKILKKYQYSNINFEIVDIFESDERW